MVGSDKTCACSRRSTDGSTLHGSTHSLHDNKIGLAIGSPSQEYGFDREKVRIAIEVTSQRFTREDRKQIGIALGSPPPPFEFDEKIGIAIGSPSQAEIDLEDFPSRRPSTASIPEPTKRQACLQVFAAVFMFMNSWGLLNAFGEYQTYYKLELLSAHSNSAISWIGSVRAFFLLGSPLLWGPVSDMGYHRCLVIGGSLLVALGELCGSLCTTLEPLIFTQGVMAGAGGGALFACAIAIVSTYFKDGKQGHALGLAAGGGSLGGAVYSIMLWRLQPQIGFAWASRCIALVVLMTSIIPCTLLKAHAIPGKRRAIYDLGVFRDPKFTIWSIAWFFGNIALYVPFFFIQQYGTAIAGFSRNHAFWLLPIMNAASISGRILPVKLANKINDPLRVIIAAVVACSLLMFGWIAIQHPTPGLFFLSAVYGFFSGAVISLSTPVTASLGKQIDGMGTKIGMLNFIGALGLLIGNPVAGSLADMDWHLMQVFCGCVFAISFCLVMTVWLLTRRSTR